MRKAQAQFLMTAMGIILAIGLVVAIVGTRGTTNQVGFAAKASCKTGALCGKTCCSTGQSCYNSACCTPKSKAVACGNMVCGVVSNGCGGTINCGTCSAGYTCQSGSCIPTCSPNQGLACDDGNMCTFGEKIQCDGSCAGGTATGTHLECRNISCTPVANTVSSCTNQCTLNLDCGCQPNPTPCNGVQCGYANDGCGDLIGCGTCSIGFTCSNGQCRSNAICGNGILEPGELCDLGVNNGVCPSSCSAACTPNVCDSCFDSDGGYSPMTWGMINGTRNGQPFLYQENCINNASLFEWYCSGSQPYSANVSCQTNYSTHCAAGACA
jgi:hypothetical protein